MPKIKQLDIDLDDVDVDGIAASQSPDEDAALLLNGALGTTLDFARQLIVTTGGNTTGTTLTIVGTDENGAAISEAVADVNTTAETTAYFKTITSATLSGSDPNTTYTLGTVDEAVTKLFNLQSRNEQAATVAVIVTGTIDFTVQETFDDYYTNGMASLAWFDVTALASKTANTRAQLTKGATGMRVKVNSYTNGAELRVMIIQSGFI
jgi:hypothetical protein